MWYLGRLTDNECVDLIREVRGAMVLERCFSKGTNALMIAKFGASSLVMFCCCVVKVSRKVDVVTFLTSFSS